jgi:cephalosporin hydroxylase
MKLSIFKSTSNFKAHNFMGTEFETNQWELSRFVVKNIIPITGFTPFPLSELLLLTSTIVYYKPDLIIDWGTHVGKSARIFYETCSFFKINSKIYTIDLPNDVEHKEHPKNKRGLLIKNIKAITMLQGDGITTAQQLTKRLKPKRILIFLDGDHEYATVKRELNSSQLMDPKPWIIVHDTFYQSSESRYNVGPHKALVEFLATYPKYKKKVLDLGLPGMTLLYKL